MKKITDKILIVSLILASILLVGCVKQESKENTEETLTLKEAVEKIKKTEAITVFKRTISPKNGEIITTPIKTIRGDEVKQLVDILSSMTETEIEESTIKEYELVFFDESEDEIGKFIFGEKSVLEIDGKTFAVTGYDVSELKTVLARVDINV